MIALRFQVPERKRHLRLPFGLLWAYVAFYICTLFIYWTGWNTIHKLLWFILGALVILIGFQIVIKIKRNPITLNWKATLWLWPYFIGIAIFSYIGNYGGGHALLSDSIEMVLIAIFCASITFLAAIFKLAPETTKFLLDAVMDETR